MSYLIDLTTPALPVFNGHLRLGGKNPQGLEINANSHYLTLGGQPWLPVMGEFHFSRYPRAEWRAELLKMKAGGIQWVATYLFWNHHEEVQGRFLWSGDRDIRHFVALCGELGLYSYPRIGPWAHGEARLGGFPDWLVQLCPQTRQDAPLYLQQVRRYYGEIAAQLDGLLWKQGGPVVGIQLENELADQPGHIRTLKQIAREVGLDVPLYTMTGWGPAQVPEDEVIPVFGGYPDAPWDRYVDQWARASRKHYFFSLIRDDNTIGADLRRSPRAPDPGYLERYPFGTCELGGGVQVTYHRRPRISPLDVAVPALCKVGSGANLLGYYMYHGGTQPFGELHSQQESQDSGYPNDLPVRAYDFQAPLGEFGQVREHYHRLRLLHLFLQDFGRELAPLPARLPLETPAGLDDCQTLRWAVRSDGQGGYLFVNTYQRIEELPAHAGVRFELGLRDGSLCIPAAPVDLPAGFSAIWPFGFDLGGARVRYATAQPVCRLAVAGLPVWVFAAAAGVPVEFALEAQSAGISGPEVMAQGEGGVYRLRPGREHEYRVTVSGQPVARLVVLDEAEALQCWKLEIGGRERLFFSPAALRVDEEILYLRSERPADLWFGVYPPPEGDTPPAAGLFTVYHLACPETSIPLISQRVSPAGPARAVPLGPAGVAQAPTTADFEQAETWQIRFPGGVPSFEGISDVRLRVDYRGDAARAMLGSELVADDFYCGSPWEIGLRRQARRVFQEGLKLQFLPLRGDAPVYLPGPERGVDPVLEVREIRTVVEYEACFKWV